MNVYRDIHAVCLPTDNALLEKLHEIAAAANPMPLFFGSPPCVYFSPRDVDAAAQREIEGRCRHKPRRVFEPNRYSKNKGRK